MVMATESTPRHSIIDKRKELGMSQDEVSYAAGISRSFYAAIERGLRDPSLETAQRICLVLKMPVGKAFPLKK